jgi:hypothetical protein
MDATVDTLLNQVASLFLDKIDKQNLDPSFLQKFANSLLGKYTVQSGRPIQQEAKQPAVTKGLNFSLVEDIKKAYKDLLKDSSYKGDYKKFLIDVLPDALTEKQIITQQPATGISVNTDEGRVKMIEEPQDKQKIIFDGFSEKGWSFFSERFPKILKDIIPKPATQQPQGGIGMFGAGIGILLSGVAALVAGLQTDGPFKGILKILSTTGIKGAVRLLEASVKAFLGSLKAVISAPINLLDDIGKSINIFFGKEVTKAVTVPLKGVKGIFAKMLGGLVKIVTPLLRRLPLIGTIISWGFAYSRFKSGDTVGGIIDVLSGIANIFPGVGTAISIGLDVLNAFLDVKTGGADQEASQKKTGLLKEWATGLGSLVWEGAKKAPIIGPLIDTINSLQEGNWFDALYNFARINPLMEPIVSLIEYFTGANIKEAARSGSVDIGNTVQGLFTWMKDSIWKGISDFVTNLIEGIKTWWNNLSVFDPGTWTKPNIDFNNSKEVKLPQSQPQTALADGGIVTKPINAVVGEAGPEAVLPLDKYFDPQSLTLNNTTLEKIAVNTNDTNNSLKVLSDALFKLIVVLDKKTTQAGTTIINAAGKTMQQATPASVIANTNADPIRRVRMQFA